LCSRWSDRAPGPRLRTVARRSQATARRTTAIRGGTLVEAAPGPPPAIETGDPLHQAFEDAYRAKPFPARVEVETDPVAGAGGAKSRRYLGRLGSRWAPLWFVIRAS